MIWKKRDTGKISGREVEREIPSKMERVVVALNMYRKRGDAENISKLELKQKKKGFQPRISYHEL